MFRRKSKRAAIQSDVSAVGARAADAVSSAASDLADRAVTAAQSAQRAAGPMLQSAQRAATPVLRSAAERSAETLSHAAERAAAVLSEAAERLADTAEERGTEAALAARSRLADATESLAAAVRPRKPHPVRRALLVIALAGAAVAAFFKSPLRSKVTDKLFGAPPQFDDDVPESITLPPASDTLGGAPVDAPDEAPLPDHPASPSDQVAETVDELEGSDGVASGSPTLGESAG